MSIHKHSSELQSQRSTENICVTIKRRRNKHSGIRVVTVMFWGVNDEQAMFYRISFQVFFFCTIFQKLSQPSSYVFSRLHKESEDDILKPIFQIFLLM